MRLLSGENQESNSGKANTSKDLRYFLSGEWSFIFREDTKKPGSNLPGFFASRGECSLFQTLLFWLKSRQRRRLTVGSLRLSSFSMVSERATSSR